MQQIRPRGACSRLRRGSQAARRSRLSGIRRSDWTSELRSGDAAVAKVLDLQELLHAVFRAFASETGLLDTAERRDLRGDDPGIDADDSVLERFRHAPDPRDVAAVEVSREPVLGIVRE